MKTFIKNAFGMLAGITIVIVASVFGLFMWALGFVLKIGFALGILFFFFYILSRIF